MVLGLDMDYLGGKCGKIMQSQQTTADPPFDSAQGRLCGNDNQKGKGRGEGKDNGNGNSRFLRCADHDKTVSSFGRNDDSFGLGKKNKQRFAAFSLAGPSTAKAWLCMAYATPDGISAARRCVQVEKPSLNSG